MLKVPSHVLQINVEVADKLSETVNFQSDDDTCASEGISSDECTYFSFSSQESMKNSAMQCQCNASATC